jgi:hypothetical protein
VTRGSCCHEIPWSRTSSAVLGRNRRCAAPNGYPVVTLHDSASSFLMISDVVPRFGTEGSEVRILSPRPKKINRNGLRSTVMVGGRPFLLVILLTFAARSRQFLIFRPDFVSGMVGGEGPRNGVFGC